MPFMQQTPPMPPMPPTSSPGGGVSSGGTPALSDVELDERIRASLGRALRELVTGDLPGSQAAGSAQGASPLGPTAPVAPKRSTRGRK
jgi:hypothetical protein